MNSVDIADLKQRLKEQALALLARREHSAQELRQKLLRKLPNPVDDSDLPVDDMLDELIYELQEANYQSDIRYIEMLLRSRVDRGYGEMYIRQELSQNKVSSELVQQCLEEQDIDWFALARKVRDKRFGLHLIDDAKLKSKQMRYLFGRGFNSEQVSHAMAPEDE